MGLPQESPSVTYEVTTSSSTSASVPPRFGGVSNHDSDDLHRGSSKDWKIEDFPCSSISEFYRKTSLEDPIGTNAPFKCRSATDEAGNLHGLKIEFKEKLGWLHPKLRVVGFVSSPFGSVTVDEKGGGDGNLSPVDVMDGNLINSNGSQVRKRLHSPLNGVVHKQFHGDMLDLSRCGARRDLYDAGRKYNIFGLHDRKKANIGSTECPEIPISPISNGVNGFNPVFSTDGPVLENTQTQPFTHFSQSSLVGLHPNNSSNKESTCSAAINISPKKVHSPPLSLSPLGPKWSDRMKTEGICRDISKEFESDFLVLKGFYSQVDGSTAAIPIKIEKWFRARNAFENTDVLHDGSDLLAPLGSESSHTPRCIKFAKHLSVVPVRRPLVGSFEESLLSGRFSSGNVGQRIDGFLAVLNVTGGSFSPPPQKLPFGVTSIDGDSSLLYYTSIDLAGSLSSSKGRGPKLKRSLSNDDSRASKSRLRIPMKGCIQLVISFFAVENSLVIQLSFILVKNATMGLEACW